MLKKICHALLIISFVVTFTSCGAKNTGVSEKSNEGQISVVTSFNAISQFVKAIGKEKVNVHTIIPNGIEPHDFEPKPKDLADISKAKIFVYNGFGMESWVDKAVAAANNKELIVVEAAKGCNPIKNTDESSIKEHGQYDPHTWISLTSAKIEAKNVKEALVKADPANKEYYEKNYNEFASKIDNMLNEYRDKFNSITNKNFVTGHAAFAYFCRDFNLTQNSIEDVFAEGEPTPKKMKELVEYCKSNNVKTIFVEDMVSPKVSETLAKEVNAKVEKIYTLESEEDNKDYLQGMKENLDKVYNSLK